MTQYRISEATGFAHWTLQASDPSDALDRLAQAHGYKDHAHACTEIGIAAQTLFVAEAA